MRGYEFDRAALQQVRETRLLINRVDDWIFGEFAPFVGKRVLDVGCGWGNLIARLLDRELVVGIDIDAISIAHLREFYRDCRRAEFYTMDICSDETEILKSFALDTAISLNVLEHLEDDVRALCHMGQIIVPEGYVIVVVPAHSWLYGTMDQVIGHLRRYDKSSMAIALARAGLVPVAQKYVNFVGALGWLVNGKLLRKRVPPTDQLRAFNIFVPILRRLERMIIPPIGISLLTVAKKAG